MQGKLINEQSRRISYTEKERIQDKREFRYLNYDSSILSHIAREGESPRCVSQACNIKIPVTSILFSITRLAINVISSGK